MPSLPDKPFTAFIGRHHVLTAVSISADGEPWCANLFYAYDKSQNVFVVTSDITTRHARDWAGNSRFAASVVLETRIVGRVQGLQIAGRVTLLKPDEPSYDTARKVYLRRFPYAAVATLTLWTLTPEQMKLTDNTLGFGTKSLWHA